jgi:hypothetical protein
MEYLYGMTMDEGPIEVAELFEWESSSVLAPQRRTSIEVTMV